MSNVDDHFQDMEKNPEFRREFAKLQAEDLIPLTLTNRQFRLLKRCVDTMEEQNQSSIEWQAFYELASELERVAETFKDQLKNE